MDLPNLKRPILHDDSDPEWEYEYHPTETETYHLTLDLSSAPSNNFASQVLKPNLPPARKKVAFSGPSSHPVPTVPGSSFATSPTPEETDRDAIQILDLHTAQPVVSYRSQIYTCDWSRTLGTDLHFVAAPAPSTSSRPRAGGSGIGDEGVNDDAALPTDPVYQGDGWALLATTGIKLVGRAMRAIPNGKSHQKQPAKPTVSASTQTAASLTDTHVKDTEASGLDGKPQVRIPLGISATSQKQAQAHFLERLIAVKQARGESDRVFIGAGRSYEDGWVGEVQAGGKRAVGKKPGLSLKKTVAQSPQRKIAKPRDDGDEVDGAGVEDEIREIYESGKRGRGKRHPGQRFGPTGRKKRIGELKEMLSRKQKANEDIKGKGKAVALGEDVEDGEQGNTNDCGNAAGDWDDPDGEELFPVLDSEAGGVVVPHTSASALRMDDELDVSESGDEEDDKDEDEADDEERDEDDEDEDEGEDGEDAEMVEEAVDPQRHHRAKPARKAPRVKEFLRPDRPSRRGGLAVGGLFRDYVPARGDGEGAELTGGGNKKQASTRRG